MLGWFVRGSHNCIKIPVGSADYQKEDIKLRAKSASILHETIHAYFISLFDEYHNGTPSNSNIYNDYVYLFNFYVTRNRPESVNSYDVHHQQMATDYVDAIARSLEEYETGVAVPSTSKPNI